MAAASDAARRAHEAEASLAREHSRFDAQRDHYAQAMDDWRREKAALEKKVHHMLCGAVPM